eukprot:SAG22_NODE_593_length_8808_cov_21.674590_4_plen_67_part_00
MEGYTHSTSASTDGDILNHGVLCESPFGKRLRVSLKDATTGKRFMHNIAGGVESVSPPAMSQNPTS